MRKKGLWKWSGLLTLILIAVATIYLPNSINSVKADVVDYAVTLSGQYAQKAGASTANNTEDYVATYTASSNYILYPTPQTITINGESVLENSSAYTFDRSTGTITILKEYIVGDIAITWNAQALKFKYSQTSLKNLSIKEESVEFALNQPLTFTITPNKFYSLPSNTSLTYATYDGVSVDSEKFTYDSETGVVTVSADAVTDVICASATAVEKIANITYTLSNVTVSQYSSYDMNQVTQGKTFYVRLAAAENYRIDYSCVEVRVNGVTLEATTDNYALTANNDRLQIKSGIIDGDVEIIITAVTNKVSISYDLKGFTLVEDPRPTEINYGNGLTIYLSYIAGAGYSQPDITNANQIKIFVDGVELAYEVGWDITLAYKVTLNKDTTKCSSITIYAHAILNEYTITLNPGSKGSLPTDKKTVTYTIETVANPLEDIVPTVNAGYTFDGWAINGTLVTWDPTLCSDYTVTAKYSTILYTITFLDGDHGTLNKHEVTYRITNSSISLPTATPNEHYAFTNWEVISADGNWELGAFSFRSGKYGNITVKANYSLKQYKITLVPTFKGSLSGNSVVTYTIEDTVAPTIETPSTTEAYTFVCWQITTASGSWTEGNYVWSPNSYGDITLTATYTTHSDYTITFIPGEHGTIDSTSTTYSPDDETINLPTVTPNAHYTHIGWTVTNGAGGWETGDEYIHELGKYGNIEVSPLYEQTKYTISTSANGKGTLSKTKYTYTYFDTEAPSIIQPNPFNAGYEFERWEIKETSGSWIGGETYAWATNSYGNVELIAIYKALPTTYTVQLYTETFDSGNYELFTYNTYEVTATTWETITLTPPAITGFTFDNDNEDNHLTVTLSGNGLEVVKAYYTRDVYTVTYTLENLTEREATVSFVTYSPYSVVYGKPFYVYLDPIENHHLPKQDIKFKVNGVLTDVPYTTADSADRLKIEAEAFAGNLEIIASARQSSFSVTYELDGVKVLEDGNDYTTIKYDTQTRFYLELTADESIYDLPSYETVQVYVDGNLINGNYSVSQAGGYVQINKAAARGDIKIVASAAAREYTITIKGNPNTTIKYTYFTDVVLPWDIAPVGYTLDYMTIPSTANAGWVTKFPEYKITNSTVGSGLLGNITITMVTTPIEYIITVLPGTHGELSNGQSNVTRKYNIETNTFDLGITAVANAGYVFDKWMVTNTTGDWDLSEFVWTTGKHGDMTITATYLPRTDIAYTEEHYFEELDGSFTLDTSRTRNLQGTTNTTINANVLVVVGYDFDEANPLNLVQTTLDPTQSIVLKCYYTRKTYTIQFDVNNTNYGQVSTAEVLNVKHGTPIMVTNNIITLGSISVVANVANPSNTETFAFENWTWQNGITTTTQNLTITANFSSSTRLYLVQFVINGGVVSSEELEYLEVPTYTGPTPEKANMVFVGWTIEGSDTILDEFPETTADTRIVAKFENVAPPPADEPDEPTITPPADESPDTTPTTPDTQPEEENNLVTILIFVGGGAVVGAVVSTSLVLIIKKRKSR